MLHVISALCFLSFDVRLSCKQIACIFLTLLVVQVPHIIIIQCLPTGIAVRISGFVAYPAKRSAVILLECDVRIIFSHARPPSCDVILRAHRRSTARSVQPEFHDLDPGLVRIVHQFFHLSDVDVIVVDSVLIISVIPRVSLIPR